MFVCLALTNTYIHERQDGSNDEIPSYGGRLVLVFILMQPLSSALCCASSSSAFNKRRVRVSRRRFFIIIAVLPGLPLYALCRPWTKIPGSARRLVYNLRLLTFFSQSVRSGHVTPKHSDLSAPSPSDVSRGLSLFNFSFSSVCVCIVYRVLCGSSNKLNPSG